MSDDFRAGKRSSGDKSDPPVGSPPSGERAPGALAGLGMPFFVALGLCTYAGAGGDRRFGSSPLWLMIGVFIGGGGTVYLTYRRLMGPGNGK
jgi:hypothetical protein